MEGNSPTYVFQNGRVFAIVAGKVVASGEDVLEVESILSTPVEETLPKTATHIVTPNGLTGQILGRHNDVWGETVTVRFENGRISTLHTATESNDIPEFEWVQKEADVTKTALEDLEARIDEDFAADQDSLVSRLADLEDIEAKASAAIHKASLEDSYKYDGIVAMARHEADEIKAAIAGWDDAHANAYQPPAAFSMQAAEQESMGGGNSSWLDHTLGEMIADAESTDFDTLMDEGPEEFVADLEDGSLADTGTVRQMAASHVRSRVAGIDSEDAAAFETAFLTRVEQVRRQALNDRKSNTKIAKEASVQEDHDGPADALFM